MLKEFKDFAMRGNVVDMAVGIIIGASFGTIVSTLVSDVLMPPIGLLMGGVNFADKMLVLKDGSPAGPYASLDIAKKAGAVSINYGLLINALISFLIVAFALFMVIKGMNSMKRQEAAAPPPPPAPSPEAVLLKEIRDVLKAR